MATNVPHYEITPDQWEQAAELLFAGRSWAQIGAKLGIPAKVLRVQGQAKGLKKAKKPAVAFVSLAEETGRHLTGLPNPRIGKIDITDPESSLVNVRERLTAVATGIERHLLYPEDAPTIGDPRDPAARFAIIARQEGMGIREYVSILKDIAKLAAAHMPYRHPTLSAVAYKDLQNNNGIQILSREEKRKRLTHLLEQSGVLEG